jgi:hypothetical protein
MASCCAPTLLKLNGLLHLGKVEKLLEAYADLAEVDAGRCCDHKTTIPRYINSHGRKVARGMGRCIARWKAVVHFT